VGGTPHPPGQFFLSTKDVNLQTLFMENFHTKMLTFPIKTLNHENVDEKSRNSPKYKELTTSGSIKIKFGRHIYVIF
jgi:hypothetical protein